MVNVLVATGDGQGRRHDDYAWAVDGELVYVPLGGCGCPGCGCSRGFVGLASGRATTTALVVERFDLDLAEVRRALADSLDRQGVVARASPEERDALFGPLFQRLVVSASHFPAGSVLERDGHVVRRRARTPPLLVPEMG